MERNWSTNYMCKTWEILVNASSINDIKMPPVIYRLQQIAQTVLYKRRCESRSLKATVPQKVGICLCVLLFSDETGTGNRWKCLLDNAPLLKKNILEKYRLSGKRKVSDYQAIKGRFTKLRMYGFGEAVSIANCLRNGCF